MNWATVRTVLAKELRETLRDRRTLFMMLVIPTLLYPAMLVLAEQLTLLGQRRLGAEPARVAVAGGDAALIRFLDADTALKVVVAESASVSAVRAGTVDAALAVVGAPAHRGPSSGRTAGRTSVDSHHPPSSGQADSGESSASGGSSRSIGSADSAGSKRSGAASDVADTALAIASTQPIRPRASDRAVAGKGAERSASPEDVRAADGGSSGTEGVRIFYDASTDKSQRAQRIVRERLEAWGDTLLARRLAAAGLPATFARPLVVADSSVATAEQAGGYTLGRFLPLLLVMMTLLGAFYPAIDMAAGEKERGTLETLLTAAVPAREIVAGKFAAVALIGMLAATANLASMLLTFQSGVFRFAKAANLRFTLPLDAAFLVLLALVPLSILFAALFLGIAVRAQSFKEAQNALTPAQLAATLPVLVVTLPGIDFTPALSLVPVVGVAMFFRELMAGRAPLLPSILAFAATVVYACAALAFAARAFGREEVLFGGGGGQVTRKSGSWREWMRDRRASGRGVPLPAEAAAFIAAVGLLYFHVGTALQSELGEPGLLLSQLLLLALPAVAFAALGPYDPRKTLALRAPSARALAAAGLIGIGGIPVGWFLGWLQLQVFEGGLGDLGSLQELLTATDLRRAAWLILLTALTPAICEELVFRGVLLQSLRREMRGWRAVVLTAVVFGAFHLSFETALRLLPTAWIGVLMGFAAWRAGSVFASMLIHFVNNAVVVMLLWRPELGEFAFRGENPSWPLVLAGAAVLAVGFWLMPRPPASAGAAVIDPVRSDAGHG